MTEGNGEGGGLMAPHEGKSFSQMADELRDVVYKNQPEWEATAKRMADADEAERLSRLTAERTRGEAVKDFYDTHLQPFADALPFLEENQQHAYDLGDGKRLLMRVNQSRILMMVTASQDRQIPNSHHWGQAAEIASDDVESWQLVSFDTTTHQINTIHYYDRETLDRIGRTNTYGFDDAQAIKTYELGDFDVEGINQLGERAQRFIGLPKELVSEIALFQERKAEIVNLVSQLKVKRDLWRGKLHKVAGQDTWLQIKDSQIGLFNSIDGPQQFLGYGFALESLEKYVLVGTSTSMEPDVVRVVDVNKLREDVASGELKREHVVMRWDKPKYTTTVLIRPGKLDEAGYETARSALTFLNGLEVEN